jgi:hypothetical protein
MFPDSSAVRCVAPWDTITARFDPNGQSALEPTSATCQCAQSRAARRLKNRILVSLSHQAPPPAHSPRTRPRPLSAPRPPPPVPVMRMHDARGAAIRRIPGRGGPPSHPAGGPPSHRHQASRSRGSTGRLGGGAGGGLRASKGVNHLSN